MVPGALPLAGDRLSQGCVSVAVQLRLPPPVLDTLMVLVAGLAPPAVAEKLRLDGEVARAPGAGVVLAPYSWGPASGLLSRLAPSASVLGALAGSAWPMAVAPGLRCQSWAAGLTNCE